MLCLCMLSFTASCAKKNNTAEELLGGIMNDIGDLPNGKVYLTSAEEGEGGYLSPELADSLYGEGAQNKLALVKDYAIYISSFAAPCEIAVFICYSSSDAIKIEQMCRQRADVLLVAHRETDLCDLNLRPTVVRKGRTVAFAMTDNAPRTERIIKKFI